LKKDEGTPFHQGNSDILKRVGGRFERLTRREPGGKSRQKKGGAQLANGGGVLNYELLDLAYKKNKEKQRPQRRRTWELGAHQE